MALRKLLIVTETYRPEVNGVATTLGHIVDQLLARDVSVTVIRPQQGKNDSPIENPRKENELLVKGLPIPGYSELKFGVATKRWMSKKLRIIQPDAVYIATEGPLGYAALMACKQHELSAMTGFHTNFQSYSRFYNFGFLEPIIMRYLQWFHNASSGTLTPTKKQCKMLEQRGFRNVSVMSRGINKQLFDPRKRDQELRAKWGAPSTHDPVFIYVGRIAAEKNLDLLADTYEHVCKKHPNAKFVLVGDGPLKPVLSRKYPELIFAGMLTGEALASHYASADIFLFPSTTDTFGNVVTEAMASGLTICAYDDAAAREHLVDRRSGLLADLGDEKQFIDNALEAFEKEHLRSNLATASLRISQSISWDSVTDQFIELMDNAEPAIGSTRHASTTLTSIK